MKVRATRMVYYGLQRQRPGSVFEINSAEEFSENSMHWVDAPPRGWVPKNKKAAGLADVVQPHNIVPIGVPANDAEAPTSYVEIQKRGTSSGDTEVI